MAKQEEQKTKKVQIEKAVVVPFELAEKIQFAIGEMQMKHSQIWGPISAELAQCHMADVELDIPERPEVKKPEVEKQ